MNSESEEPRISTRLWVFTASVETQARIGRGRLPGCLWNRNLYLCSPVVDFWGVVSQRLTGAMF